jgi:hypothetical protein
MGGVWEKLYKEHRILAWKDECERQFGQLLATDVRIILKWMAWPGFMWVSSRYHKQ